MKRKFLFVLTATMLAGFAACTDPKVPVENPLDADGFPRLSTMPQSDVYKQKKSEKRGISTRYKIQNMPELLGPGINWAYDWSHQYNAEIFEQYRDNGITFAPMVWSGEVNQSVLTSIARNGIAEYVLGYNEPNLTGQAQQTPQVSGELWPRLVNAAQAADLKIVSPAMCHGNIPGYEDPTAWLDEFLTQPGVSLDQMVAIAGHAYMPNTAGVKGFVRMFKKYGKPFWLTEFCHANNSISPAASQPAFMGEILSYLEADDAVEKYAWFMDSGTSGGNTCELFDLRSNPRVLNSLGVLYISASSLDKTTYYTTDENIPAEHYSDTSATASANAEVGWTAGVYPQVTTDMYGTLEITNFVKDGWIEYMIDVPADGEYRFDIRYATQRDVVMLLQCDGLEDQLIAFDNTGAYDNWTTVGTKVNLKAGKQTIRLANQTGTARFNWFRFTSKAK